MTDRSQIVKIDGVCTTTRIISRGVPQGLIMGLGFYVIYTNELPKYINKQYPLCNIICFADNTNIIVSGSDIEQVRICAE